MNVVVCIKRVPDTETVIKIKPDASGIVTEGIKYITSPYDEFALEEGLRIKEKFVDGSVTLITLGSKDAVENLRTGLAMGADRGILLDDPAFEGADTYSTALALARCIKDLEYNIILCGRQAIDDDCAQIPGILSEFLGISQVTWVIRLEVAENKKSATAYRLIEGGAQEVIDVQLPAIISVTKGINEPRYASLPGIMKAKKKEVKELNCQSLGLSPEEVGRKGARLNILKFFSPPERAAGRVIEGSDAAEKAAKLVKLLREEAKII